MMKKIFGRRAVTFILTLSLVSSAFYLPVFAPRAHAFFVFTTDVKVLAKTIVDGIAMATAQTMINEMVKSTVNWAQTGFEGNPAYVINPEQYFTNLADGVAGEFIAGSDLAGLCSPFQAQIRLALQRSYIQERQFQCTLTDVIGNIEAFYGDFNQGGWDAWFAMTQNSSNNPYGAFLDAQIELDSRIASTVGLQREQLNWNQGFLSWAECAQQDPDTGECYTRGPIKTPGTTIKSQLDRVLPSGLEKLVQAEHVEQLISAFATGLLNRYVFGPKGLFDNEPNNASTNPPSIPESNPCEEARDLYGDNVDCNPDSNNPFPQEEQ